MPLSVVPLSVPPPVLANTTVAPPTVKELLFASRACTVMSLVLVPLAVSTAVAGLTRELAAFGGPATKVTTDEEAPTAVPTGTPPRVAVTVAAPVNVGAVSIAV